MTLLAGALLDAIVTRALDEDLAAGDPTTEALVGVEDRAIARAVAREPLVVCGADVFARVFYAVDAALRVERQKDDGDDAVPGDVLFVVEGSTRSILAAERTGLNFAQRLSGIATLTRRYVRAIPPGATLRITDTRKTTPGLRLLERHAVRTGGGTSHRNDLGSAILIKDNHIVAAGGVARAVELARRYGSHTSRVEVEVESLPELDAALGAGADVVMLDNFAEEDLGEAVARARGRALVEVSGNLTPERIARLAELGVDRASVGALTHSARAVDISLTLERLG